MKLNCKVRRKGLKSMFLIVPLEEMIYHEKIVKICDTIREKIDIDVRFYIEEILEEEGLMVFILNSNNDGVGGLWQYYETQL